MHRVLRYMDPKRFQCKHLISFFEKYPSVKRTNEEYQTPEGLKERADWAVMLNTSNCMYLKRKQMNVVQIGEGGCYEVAATIENLFEFFENFFPKINFSKGKNNEEKLKLIFKALSCFEYKFEIDNFLEYEQEGGYKSLQHFWTIKVNDEPILEWIIWSNLSPVYDENENIISKKRTGGHSDYRFKS